MKNQTQPQPDKAMAQFDGQQVSLAVKSHFAGCPELTTNELVRIACAVNEHAALCAVAEAANQLIYTQNSMRSTGNESIVSTLSVQHVRELLAALAAVRN